MRWPPASLSREWAVLGRWPSMFLPISTTCCLCRTTRNTRALFERALQAVSPEHSIGIWQLYLDYETRHGDRVSLLELLQRIVAVFPQQATAIRTQLFLDRFSADSLRVARGRAEHALRLENAPASIPLAVATPRPFAIPEAVLAMVAKLPSPAAYAGPQLANVDLLLSLIPSHTRVREHHPQPYPQHRRDGNNDARKRRRH